MASRRTTSKTKRIELAFQDASEALAEHLADRNDVEIAWLVRGFSDAVTGAGRDIDLNNDPTYGRYYRKGYSALMIH